MHKVYYARIKPLRKEEIYNLYLDCLPKERQINAKKHLHKDDKIRSVAAFTLLTKLLKDNHISYKDKDFKVDKNGKPYLAGSNIYFNIAHGGEYVIAGISDHPIGVDVEYIKREKKYKEIVDLVFNQEEKDEFHHSIFKKIFFYQVWTMKESYLKCIGKGLQIAMPTINVSSPELKGYNFRLFFLKNHQFSICLKDEMVAQIKEMKL